MQKTASSIISETYDKICFAPPTLSVVFTPSTPTVNGFQIFFFENYIYAKSRQNRWFTLRYVPSWEFHRRASNSRKIDLSKFHCASLVHTGIVRYVHWRNVTRRERPSVRGIWLIENRPIVDCDPSEVVVRNVTHSDRFARLPTGTLCAGLAVRRE